MKYLVMECHPGFAVVLDEQGRFLKAANMGYQVGQSLDSIAALQEVENPASLKPHRRLLRTLAAAACLCLVLLGSWHVALDPFGTVRMQINPSVELTVNRLDYVIAVNPVNEDGARLLQGFDPGTAKVDAVADALADRAREQGYLTAGGEIHVQVFSQNEAWRSATQERLVADLRQHTGGDFNIIPDPQPEQTLPTLPPEESWEDDDDAFEDDEDDEDDDDKDDEDDDDEDDDEDDEEEEDGEDD